MYTLSNTVHYYFVMNCIPSHMDDPTEYLYDDDDGRPDVLYDGQEECLKDTPLTSQHPALGTLHPNMLDCLLNYRVEDYWIDPVPNGTRRASIVRLLPTPSSDSPNPQRKRVLAV